MQKLSTLFLLIGHSPVSVASLMVQYMYTLYHIWTICSGRQQGLLYSRKNVGSLSVAFLMITFSIQVISFVNHCPFQGTKFCSSFPLKCLPSSPITLCLHPLLLPCNSHWSPLPLFYLPFPVHKSSTFFMAPFLSSSPCSYWFTMDSHPVLYLKPFSTGCSLCLLLYYCILHSLFNQ
jgi:hypothetical protein